jgi:hypothetical protein
LTTHFAFCGWYLDYPVDSTLKSKCGLREKFEDDHLNKLTSTDSSFRGGKKSHNAKRSRKTKNQSARLSGEKLNEEDREQEELVLNQKAP